MSSSQISNQTFKECSNKITQQQQQSQLQAFQALLNGSCNSNGGSSNSNQSSIVIQQSTPQINSQLNAQSPLLTSSLQHKKVSQKIQLKAPQQVQGQSQSVIINALVYSQSLNQQSNQQIQNIQQNGNTVIQQNALNSSLNYNGQQQVTANCLQAQQNISSSSSSVNSSYSLQSQLSSQNSLQNGSLLSNPILGQQQPQQNPYSLQNCIVIANQSSIQQPNQQQSGTQNQQNSYICPTIQNNGSGQAGPLTFQTNNNNNSMALKKQQCDENGIYFSQKKKLLQIIQKQQKEQQEFEKQQQLTMNLSVAVPQSSEEFMQEIAKSQQKQKPIKVITSPNSNNSRIRNLLKKYQRNISREDNLTNLNSSSIMTPQLQLNQAQINSTGASFTQNFTSPIKRPSNGMNRDEKFLQGIQSNKICTMNLQQNTTDDKHDSQLKQEAPEQIEEVLQDNFDDYRNILDEEDLAFLDEIENVCSSIPKNQNNNSIQNKVLYNKNFNKQISTQSNSQSNSSINTPPNSANSKLCNDNLQINNSSINTKENDCPKAKESNFKRIVKTNVSISTNNCAQQSQNQHTSQSQKPVISQILNWFDSSFERKNNSSNSEFFQALETEDSLATTQITALSSCTPQSISQNILNLFSPLADSSEGGSTISFNNTNSSIKQAIQSLQQQSSESSSLVFEQIKQQIELQKQQLQQKFVNCSAQGQDTLSVKQPIQQQHSNQQTDKKVKLIGNQVVKNAIQSLSIENLN
ncbi:hypothetical protein TTHERM_00653820 (macronuclear) [Tetrahymena thermophila SB210]|uniref:Uncharacterized protein n=1 Tax=Tetrahymena thermophila (strain SB210) TaxID=312017 RepID=Q23AZ5_TETTS|nr:hypothetical protein TTHERM_00653820 [Tetrahymena thermophila SB210]EAR93689.1 hypothetical protein TTHERM_00653820 [Tetrahymena thermophila SB210]|eukprot:XP_001013934.1 hypothetical protein TTHERM_00653820 [Tetrahymena thermophila SB210]